MNALLVILSVLLCFQVIAEEKQMYRWRDANNELHVGHIPPTNLPFETITVSSNRQTVKDDANTNNLANTKDDASATLSATERQRNCERAQSNLQILAQDKPVYVQTASGGSELLDKTALAEHQALAKTQVDFYCSK